MNPANKIKIILALLIVVVILLLLNIYWLNDNKNKPVASLILDDCNAQLQKCSTSFDDVNIDISIDENIFYLEKFNVSILTESAKINIENISIDFKMKNMNMGLNRFWLMKKSTHNKKQVWLGKALLPVCITGRADWFAEVTIVTNEKNYILSFPVLVKRVRN